MWEQVIQFMKARRICTDTTQHGLFEFEVHDRISQVDLGEIEKIGFKPILFDAVQVNGSTGFGLKIRFVKA